MQNLRIKQIRTNPQVKTPTLSYKVPSAKLKKLAFRENGACNDQKLVSLNPSTGESRLSPSATLLHPDLLSSITGLYSA